MLFDQNGEHNDNDVDAFRTDMANHLVKYLSKFEIIKDVTSLYMIALKQNVSCQIGVTCSRSRTHLRYGKDK